MNTPTSPTTITRKGTFADLLAGHVQRKCHGYASLAYNAAWINRRTWSAIVTNPHRPVAKRTCIDDGVFNLFAVNQRLHDNGAKIIPPL